MEFGPRALGARSILADPRNEQMQSVLNRKIKFRESFRPFAPAVLAHRAAEYFEHDAPSPYMSFVAPVRASLRVEPSPGERRLEGFDKLKHRRSRLPAVTHVDYSARLQTVHEKTNPRFFKLLEAFEARTGCPVLVNTSFNVRGEPIVCTPEEAYRCFMRTEMDCLAVEDFLLAKSAQAA
jgi:carbamoyltransferase